MDLLHNAMDYLNEAVQRLSRPLPMTTEFKYSILALCSAIELLLKHRLSVDHWSLVFAKTDEASQAKLKSGDFLSVSPEQAIKRIESICGISLAAHKPLLENLRKIRNRVQHFDMSVDRGAARAFLVEGWSFVLDFVSDHISWTGSPKARKAFDSAKRAMVVHQTFVKKRLLAISRRIVAFTKRKVAIVRCPTCLQEALPLDKDDKSCLYCRAVYALDGLPSIFEATFDDRRLDEKIIDPDFLKRCPECDEESMYFGKDRAICLRCGNWWDRGDFRDCPNCGRLFLPTHDDLICQGCIDQQG